MKKMSLGLPRNSQDNSRNMTGFLGISEIHLIRDLYQFILRGFNRDHEVLVPHEKNELGNTQEFPG